MRRLTGSEGQEIESSEIRSYIVADTADDSKQFEVEPERLFRVRNILSKAVIRTIIKDSATKDTFLGAPWIVHEQLALEFNISTVPPEDIWDAETKTFRRKKKAAPRRISGMAPKLSRPKFPVEDTEVPLYVSRKAHPEMETSAVPLPKSEFTVPAEIIPDMLYIWSFLFVYAQPLGLFPFSFDEFERAMKQDEYPLSPIISDLHVVLMKNAAEKTSATVARLTKQGVKPKKILAKSIPKIKSDTSMVVDEPVADLTADAVSQATVDTEEATAQLAEEEEVEMNDLPPEDNQMVNMMDYSYMGMWWRWKITDESWINSLVALLFHLATVRDFPSLPDIIRILTKEEPVLDSLTGRLFLPSATPWKDTELIDRYLDLELSHKIDILAFLISESVVDSAVIHRYIDSASLEWLELRKERRELEGNKKVKLEEHKQLDKEMIPIPEDASAVDGKDEKKKEPVITVNEEDDDEIPGATDAEEDSGDEEIEEEEDSEELKDLKVKLLELEANDGPRQEKMRLQTQIREIEDGIHQTKLEAARALARERNAKSREKRKLDSEMEKIEIRELELDRAIRTSAGCLRVKPLGMDRFWNKYWWLDGYGSGVLGVLEYGFVGPKASTIAYGTGKIWVEGAGKLDCLGYVSGGANGMLPGKRRRAVANDADSRWCDPFVTIPEGFEDRLPGEGMGENWLKEGEFKYYDEVEHVDELLCWLNPKGVREQILKMNLSKYYDQITHGMQKRKEDQQKITETMDQIQQQMDKPHRGRPKSTKAIDTHLYYKNRWAF